VTSPDLRAFVDLTVYDVSPTDLVNRAVTALATILPDLDLRAGTTERAIIEAVALQDAELAYAINRVPGAVAEIQARLFGVVRSPGLRAAATVTFTLADTIGHTIPAGTRLLLADLDEPVIFTTDADLIIAPASSTGTTAVTATSYGSIANGVVTGTTLRLLDALSYVQTVALATDVAGGADPDGVSDWLTRATQRYARLTETLVLPAHFQTAAREDPTISRAQAIDNWDPTIPGAALGHVTVAVLGVGGALLSSPAKATLEATLEDAAQVNLDVHVVDPTITAVNVTATVHRLAGFTNSEVQTNIVAALTAYLSPDTWPWAATVRRNELIALIDGVAGVDYVDAGQPTTPAADVALSGIAPLADIGTVTITVTI
jgi:uncharacterized phage protein gp47/JayE